MSCSTPIPARAPAGLVLFALFSLADIADVTLTEGQHAAHSVAAAGGSIAASVLATAAAPVLVLGARSTQPAALR